MEDQIWLEGINRSVQRLLAESALHDREVELRGQADLSLEIAVDGKVYRSLDEIPDVDIRGLIQAAIDEWQDEAEAAVLAQATLPAWRPAPFRNRIWVVVWLIAMIVVFVLPPMFIIPTHMAARFSLSCAGGMLGGLIGALGGRAIARRVTGKENSRTWMFWGLLGGGLAAPLGFAITISVLSVIP